jgi:hypothetical protein
VTAAAYVARIVAEDSRPPDDGVRDQIRRYLAARRWWLARRRDLPTAPAPNVQPLPASDARATLVVSSEGAPVPTASVGGVEVCR